MMQSLLKHLQHACTVPRLGAEHPVRIEPRHQQAWQKSLRRVALPAPQDAAGEPGRDAGREQRRSGAAIRARHLVQRAALQTLARQKPVKLRQAERQHRMGAVRWPFQHPDIGPQLGERDRHVPILFS